MLTGRITAEREAVIQVQVFGSNGQIVPVEAAIDTGYDGFLTLPASLIRDLELPFAGTTRVLLADGSDVSESLERLRGIN